MEADWFKGEWTTLRVYALLAREWRAAARALKPRPVSATRRGASATSAR